MVLVVKNPLANAGDTRDVGLIPGLGRFPGVENGNPLQYSSNPETTGGQTLGSQRRHFYSSTRNLGQGTGLPSAQGVFSFFWSPPLFFRNLSSRPLSRSSSFTESIKLFACHWKGLKCQVTFSSFSSPHTQSSFLHLAEFLIPFTPLGEKGKQLSQGEKNFSCLFISRQMTQ